MKGIFSIWSNHKSFFKQHCKSIHTRNTCSFGSICSLKCLSILNRNHIQVLMLRTWVSFCCDLPKGPCENSTFKKNKKISAYPLAKSPYFLNYLSCKLKEMDLIIFLFIVFCFYYKTCTEMEKFYKGVFLPLPKTKYFASVRICIFYTKYATGMFGQGGEHSLTAQNMYLPKQNLHNVDLRLAIVPPPLPHGGILYTMISWNCNI